MNDGTSRDGQQDDSFDALLARAARLSPVSEQASSLRLYPGVTLVDGRFQVLSRLGAGGMGVVFEAFDRQRGVTVAFKTVPDLGAAGIYRLKQEFRALAGIVHPNLVRLHELFNDGELWLFSMERVRGQPFDAWVRSGDQADPGRIRRGFAQLLSGVQAIHEAGKLHRDLKPRNVLVEHGTERIVILDFGLAAEPGAGGRGQTLDTGISGTPLYMAPEQAAGEPASAASDLYAVGVMLFEALTGVAPFEAAPLAVLTLKQLEAAPRARQFVATVPEDLEALCARLLERDPAARPDAAAVRAALGAHEAHPVPAAPSERTPATRLFGRDAALDQLRAALRDAAAGTPSVVSIVGESGIGKTALGAAFVEEVRASGAALVLEGRCYERECVPYKAWDRVVDDLTRQLRQRSDAEVAAVLPRDAAELGRLFPVLSRIEAVARAQLRPTGDAAASLRRAWSAFAELLGRLRMRGPVVVLVDDLHWLDHDSAALFEQLLGDADLAALLLVISHPPHPERPLLLDRVHAAARHNHRVTSHVIELEALAPEATLALVSELLGPVQLDASLVRERAERAARESAGNPFFVSELVHGMASLPRGSQASSVSLDEALRARVSRLGPTAARLLDTLAIAGRPTPGSVAAGAVGACDDPHQELDLLCSARLLRELPERRYECYHDRVRLAVSSGMSPEAVRLAHAALAGAWERHGQAPAEIVFVHLFAAGERARAGEYALRAADAAAESFAFEQCARFLEQAMALLPVEQTAAGDLRFRRAEALSYAGLWADAAVAYGDASAHCADALRRERMLLHSATHALGSGQAAVGLPLLRGVFERAGARWPRTSGGALAGAVARFAWLWLRSRFDRRPRVRRPSRGPSLARDVESLLIEHWLSSSGVVPAYDLARGLYFMSVFTGRALRSESDAFFGLGLAVLSMMFSAWAPTKDRAARLGERAAELAHSHAEVALSSATLAFVAYAHWMRGESAAAHARGVEAARVLETVPVSHPYTAWVARTIQAYALLTMGRLTEAMPLLDDNERVARQRRDELGFIGGTSVLRWLASDQLDVAHALLAQKQSFLERSGVRGALWELVRVERVLCALYEGRGAEVMGDPAQSAGLLPWFDPDVPLTCAALQADPAGSDPRTRRLVRRSIAVLRGRGPGAAYEALRHQLAAALALLDGRHAEVVPALQNAARRYADADMGLHAALMRLRLAELQSAGADASEEAIAFLGAQGIANPAAWLRMLAPGLSRPT